MDPPAHVGAEQDEFFDAEDGSIGMQLPAVADTGDNVAEPSSPSAMNTSPPMPEASGVGATGTEGLPCSHRDGPTAATEGVAGLHIRDGMLPEEGAEERVLTEEEVLTEERVLTEEEVQESLSRAVEAKERGNVNFRNQGQLTLFPVADASGSDPPFRIKVVQQFHDAGVPQ